MYEIIYQNAGQPKPHIVKIKDLDWKNLQKVFKKDYPSILNIDIDFKTWIGKLTYINDYGEGKISFKVTQIED